MLTIIGLGPADESFITAETLRVIANTTRGFVRTLKHPAASAVRGFESFDSVYESANSLSEVYETIVKTLLDVAAKQDVVYAVPGSPYVAEHTVQLLLEQDAVNVSILPAMSFLDLAWDRLCRDPFGQATSLCDGHDWLTTNPMVSGAALIAQCDSKDVLSAIKLSVEEPTTTVQVLQRLGLSDEKVFEVFWDDLDREVEPDHLTSIWVPEFPRTVGTALAELGDVIRRLRAQCPWDAKQTHMSLAKYLLEEAYETVEAIGAVDADTDGALNQLIEELGDVFMQVYMHAAIGAQAGEFTIVDVADGVREKLIHRHPHVFGDVVAETAEDVRRNWDELKAAEGKSVGEIAVSGELPALMFTAELRKQLAKRGFYYLERDELLADVHEEVRELEEALTASGGEVSSGVFGEYGDVLLAAVVLGNALGIDPEVALRAKAADFHQRYERFEALVNAQHIVVADLSREDMITLWKQAKA